MDNRLELERRGREPPKVRRMTLDNCRSQTTNGISENLAQYSNLEYLSIINGGLTTLKGFPRLPQLRKLDISDNRLAGGLNHVAEACPRLETILLGGNRFKDLDALEPLKQLKDLKHLDMLNCDIVAMEDYRQKVFNFLPQLTDLDSFDRENNEVLDDEDVERSDNDEDDDDDDGGEGDSDEDVENHNGAENDENHNSNGVDHDESDEGSEMDNFDDEEEEEDESDEGEEHIPPPIPHPIILLDEEDEDDDDDEDENEDVVEDEEDDDDEVEQDEENEEAVNDVIQSAEVGSRGLKRAHSEEEEDEVEDDDDDNDIEEIEG